MGDLALDAAVSPLREAQPKATLATLVGSLAGYDIQPHLSHHAAHKALNSPAGSTHTEANLRPVNASAAPGSASAAAPAAVERFGAAAVPSARPPHDHFRPCWAQPGAVACRPLLPHINSIAVPLEREDLDRWHKAAQRIAQDQQFERDVADRLALPEGLPSAEVAAGLIRQLLEREQRQSCSLAELLQAAVQRCVEQEFWSALEEFAARPGLRLLARCRGLVAQLAEHAQYKLLAIALCQAEDLTAGEVAAALQLLLAERSGTSRALRAWQSYARAAAESCVTSAESSVGVEGVQDATLINAEAAVAAVEGFDAQEVCLHGLIAGAHDNAIILAALRQLNGDEVLSLVRYLSKLTERLSGSALSEAPVCALPPGLAVPSLTTVLSWAAATLDTHFLTLATQPAAVLQTLLGLKGCVTEDLRVSQRVASLGGALAHIHRHAPLPTFSTAAAHTYSVELLDLSVRKGK